MRRRQSAALLGGANNAQIPGGCPHLQMVKVGPAAYTTTPSATFATSKGRGSSRLIVAWLTP